MPGGICHSATFFIFCTLIQTRKPHIHSLVKPVPMRKQMLFLQQRFIGCITLSCVERQDWSLKLYLQLNDQSKD